jgi:hypothetical protein
MSIPREIRETRCVPLCDEDSGCRMAAEAAASAFMLVHEAE